MPTVPVDATHPAFAAVAALFDDYRVHYGCASSPTRTRDWLARAPLTVTADLTSDGVPRGLITTAVVPASLLLGAFWQIRDLYVAPAHRRSGVARHLLDQVVTDARAAGAVRLSLQTETTNATALALYTSVGFTPVDGLRQLSLAL